MIYDNVKYFCTLYVYDILDFNSNIPQYISHTLKYITSIHYFKLYYDDIIVA